MIQLNKAILLYLGCVVLVSISGCGGSSNLIPPPNGFLYSGNSARPGSMAASAVTTGLLTHINGSPFSTSANGAPNAPYSLAAWPPPQFGAAAVTTKFLYAGIPSSPLGGVINRVLNRPLGSSVTGGIMLMPIKSDHTLDTPQMFASGGDYDPIAVSPTGNFLYAIDLTADLLVPFSIDSNKGTLTAIAQGSMPVGPDPFNVVVDPQGQFVFVANCDCTAPSGQGSVSVFSINSSTGALTNVQGSPFPLGGGAAHPIALAVSPDSQFLFVAGLDNNVYVENVAAGSPVDQGSAPLPTGSTPVSIAVSTDGNYVYTGNAGNHTISFFLNCLQATPPTGCPTSSPPPLAVPSNSSTVPLSGTVGVILTDPTNPAPTSSTTPPAVSGFLYVTDYDHGTVQAYSITSVAGCGTVTTCIPGTLTQSGSAVNTGGVNPFGLAIAH